MRLFAKVKKTPRCWLWTGRVTGLGRPNNLGYGVLKVGQKNTMAHRLSFTIHRGEIPEGKLVMHKCDNPLCVRPSHLFLGTQKDNVADCVSKDRHSRGTVNKVAKLTDEIVREIRRRYKPYDRKNGGDAMAKEFGVHSSVVNGIVNGKRWRHVRG